jgi:hypothetical protein
MAAGGCVPRPTVLATITIMPGPAGWRRIRNRSAERHQEGMPRRA